MTGKFLLPAGIYRSSCRKSADYKQMKRVQIQRLFMVALC